MKEFDYKTKRKIILYMLDCWDDSYIGNKYNLNELRYFHNILDPKGRLSEYKGIEIYAMREYRRTLDK